MAREVEFLEDMCVRRVCEDVVRHVAKWKSEDDEELSDYLLFWRSYSDDLQTILRELPRRDFLTIRNSAYTDIVNFILNPSVKRADFGVTNVVNEVTAAAVIKNCKNLSRLTIFAQKLDKHFHMDLLKSMSNLEYLGLDFCIFKGVPVIKIITNYMANLRYLSLNASTTVDDNIMFILCGHEWIDDDLISVCSLARNCNSTCKLKLLYLDIARTSVTRLGLACVLTHILTLRLVDCFEIDSDDLLLSQITADINMDRNRLGLDSLQFQLGSVDFVNDSKVLEACLQSCPRLTTLKLIIESGHPEINTITGRTLNENDLTLLETFRVKCKSLDEIFNEEFKRFWTRRGKQIKHLRVSPYHEHLQIEADFDIVKGILTLCPNLESLSFKYLWFPSSFPIKVLLDFPKLHELENLVLVLDGDTRLLNIFARELILSARNLGSLNLRFSINETILPSISEANLPHLYYLFVDSSKAIASGNQEVIGKLLNLIRQDSRSVEVKLHK